MAHGACDTMCGSQVSCDSGYAMFGSNSAQPTEEEGRSSHDLCHSVGRPQRLMPCVSTAHGVEFAARYAVAVPHIALHSKLVGSLMSNPSTAQHSKSDKPYASTAHRVASALRATPVPHITTKQAPTNLVPQSRTWDSEYQQTCYCRTGHGTARAYLEVVAQGSLQLLSAPCAISVPHIALQKHTLHAISELHPCIIISELHPCTKSTSALSQCRTSRCKHAPCTVSVPHVYLISHYPP